MPSGAWIYAKSNGKQMQNFKQRNALVGLMLWRIDLRETKLVGVISDEKWQ